jgi:hypothetical protein
MDIIRKLILIWEINRDKDPDTQLFILRSELEKILREEPSS